MTERDRVKGEVQRILLQYMGAIHAQLIHSHDDVFLADKILSIKGVAILSDNQELPDKWRMVDCGNGVSMSPRLLSTEHTDGYDEAQQDIIKDKFRRII